MATSTHSSSSQTWSGKPTELYYRLMTPKWLGNRSDKDITWNSNFKEGEILDITSVLLVSICSTDLS